MPVYQDPDRRHEQPPWLREMSPSRPPLPDMHRTSEESIRTEFCEGPLPDETEVQNSPIDHLLKQRSDIDMDEFPRPPLRDRAALIEHIKRAQNPSQWTKDVALESSRQVEQDAQIMETSPISRQASLLPAITLKGPISPEEAARNEETSASNLQAGREIQRPGSALHAGDFTEASSLHESQLETALSSSKLTEESFRSPSKLLSSPSIKIGRPRRPSFSSPQATTAGRYPFECTPPPRRPRAPSLHSYSSSFVYKVPTSPLVQQENNDDIDNHAKGTLGSDKHNRRRTLPPDSFQNFRLPPSTLAQAARRPSSFQVDISLSSQARNWRRSSTFERSFAASVSPPIPGFLRSRGTSFSGDASPMQRSSLVGGYENSIISGRMSTPPSGSFEFTAQIGALGKGSCKPKFPDHVTLSFPAVYYNWNSYDAADLPSTIEPSPYVGQIDLENGLPTPKRRGREERREEEDANKEVCLDKGTVPSAPCESVQRRKRSLSPTKRPPGGSYRIPQQGQVQILIKNPNKTAVKLFLIPYNLEGMEPGTKTFIRQNAYSEGPIIEGLKRTSRSGGSVLERQSGSQTPRRTLRYSIQLHICCPSKGRFYLYRSIKVVFANRVPDNKERLSNEIRLPEPRFSTYRPHEVQSSPSISAFGRSVEKEHRLRSFQTDGAFDMAPRSFHQRLSSSGLSSVPPVPPLPTAINWLGLGILSDADTDLPQQHHLSPNHKLERRPSSPSPKAKTPQGGNDMSSSIYSNSSNNSTDSAYSKLNKGDVGYGGLLARPGTPEASEGLLSRRLRGLECDPLKSPSTQRE